MTDEDKQEKLAKALTAFDVLFRKNGIDGVELTKARDEARRILRNMLDLPKPEKKTLPPGAGLVVVKKSRA